ncbi:hypothetical protein EFR00_28355 [Rhizobium sophoriradicis]|uniref:hypothetical protein n=1 Tax=Rhizobium sophoriradicis TaxID=1535245 RepID=UPI00098F8865|nr:hypothetical protein [Rhizobium sophoriradicis]RSB86873.1 hypothetical protein EFR00_28355 [Rhizobium sophoriradicis]
MAEKDWRAALRDILRDVLNERSDATAPVTASANPTMAGYPETLVGDAAPRDLPARLMGVAQPARPAPADVAILPNARAKLTPGKMVLGVQKDNSVHIFDPSDGTFEIYCRLEGSPMLLWRAIPGPDGKLFIAMSGTRWPGHPTEVAFGQGGAIFLADHRDENLFLIPGSETFLDPGEILFQKDALVVVDFMGFGGSGKIYKLDPKTGTRTLLFEGEPLKEPVALAALGEDEYVIANSFMRYAPTTGPGGAKLKEMGALLHLRQGRIDIIHDETRTPRGVIDSVAVDDQDGTYILYSRNDWPLQESGGIFVRKSDTGEIKPLLEASEHETIFARVSDVMAGIGAVADSYNKVLYTVDVKAGTILDKWSLEPVLGTGKGMVTPLETVESIRWLR